MAKTSTAPQLRLLIKIVNENYAQLPKVVGDVANKEHIFEWNDAVGAYCMAPKAQEDIDNILALNWMMPSIPFRYSVVMIQAGMVVSPTTELAPGQSAPQSKIPPFVAPELYASHPIADLLMLCQDCGFAPAGDTQDEHNLRRQLHAYFVGRAWANEEIRRMAQKILQLETAAEPDAPAGDAGPAKRSYHRAKAGRRVPVVA